VGRSSGVSLLRRATLAFVAVAALFSFAPSAGAVSTSLVINEVDYDQPSTDTSEFLELENTSDAAINLDSWTVELVNGTGGGASVYQTIDLPAVSLAAGDYFVVCANAATTANCDLDVSPDTNLIQNGSPDAIGLKDGSTLVDALSYEGDSGAPYTEGSGAGLEDNPSTADMGIARCPDGSDSDQNNADFLFRAITPGAANDCPLPPPPFGTCGDGTETRIHDVQGAGPASPLAGSVRVVEGIVVGDFQGADALDGFFLQEEDADADADAATSEGLFVFAPGALDVAVGDRVRVEGTVAEFSGKTELSSVSDLALCASGEPLPTATALSLPVFSLDEFEPTEGMLVTFPQTLFISEYFNFDRFGEIVLTSARQFQPTAVEEPGSPAAQALAAANALGRITLDDGRNAQNPDPALHPNGAIFDLTNRFRGGDTVTDVTGVLDYAFGLYRIQPTDGADYEATNPRPAAPDAVGGNVTVASFNVLNYFTTLADDGPVCGPQQDQDCRGANDANELERQQEKIVAALAGLDADVVGLIELENAPTDTPLATLVGALNASVGAGTYAYVATGSIGGDAIKTAFIYKPASVSPLGDYAVLDSSVDPRFLDTKNRPALAQTFQASDTGGIFTVVVNHLKSKGSDCNDVGDPDTGDGSGNCNLTRTAAAQALVDWIGSDPTGSGDPDVLVIGDLNSYDKEDPIDAFLAGGFTDLVRAFGGEYAYSYVFDGQLGYLDHALAGSALVDEVTGTTVWHTNADEPDILDYDTTFKQPAQEALFEPNAYRSSDHDPVVIGLDVCDEIAPTLEVSVSPEMLWPPNHKYVEVKASVSASDNFDPTPTVTLVSVTSNEPDDALGGADGNTTNDIVIVDDTTFKLRAERDETGTGRIYTITYRVSDACGNTTTKSATVSIPVRD
jgi:predicted extracellular nuclease